MKFSAEVTHFVDWGMSNCEEAKGRAASCEGCPSQKACMSNKPTEDPDTEKILQNLSNIKHILLVLSGKGGVGKSTLSTQLAFLMSQTKQVGLLDLDICGPSIAKLTNSESETIHQGLQIQPICLTDTLISMSPAYFTKQALIWRSEKKNGLIKTMLRDVDYGELDFLVVDMPPGTSDEHLSIVSLLKKRKLHCIVVTTPSDLSLLDVGKEISFIEKVGIVNLGLVQNMTKFKCTNCMKEKAIFGEHSGNYLAEIDIDPLLCRYSDEGKFVDCDRPAFQQLEQLASKILSFFE